MRMTNQTTFTIRLLTILVFLGNVIELGSTIGIHSMLYGRAYAISGGKISVAAGLGLILASYIGITISLLLLESINAFNPLSVYFTLRKQKTHYNETTDTNGILKVMAITVYFSWTFIKQFRNVLGISRKTLTALFLQQGAIRFLMVLILNLESSITVKVLNPWLAGFDAGLQNVSVCNF
ncbi:hypothetical protein M422DRAFT_259739 [Sphaerobolus stellatus SS14]|uniref:Uncharacterized protein n=1 Tax=Sphaerobolus stellatus (strain SS14) TaxID=990650 RepID=A0A0C9U3Y6_SPHS4|nr:hypothetical protein M422DRAFT_259739 [Sphaerobolus stellatus SS14]